MDFENRIQLCSSIVALIVPFIMYFLEKYKSKYDDRCLKFNALVQFNYRLYLFLESVVKSGREDVDVELFERLCKEHLDLYFSFRLVFYKKFCRNKCICNCFNSVDKWFCNFSSEYTCGFVYEDWKSFFDVIIVERDLLVKINDYDHYFDSLFL